MDAPQQEVRTEELDVLSSRTKWSLEWIRHGNQVEPIIYFDGKPIGLVRDVKVMVDPETALPILSLSVVAPGLGISQRDIPSNQNAEAPGVL